MHHSTSSAAIRSFATPRRGLLSTLAAASIAVVLAACGGAGPDQRGEDGDSQQAGPAVGRGGGGGTLTFDGEEIPIANVTCVLEADTFDVGTVSDNQFRVFVSHTNPANPVSVQILDADSVQWFPQGNPAEPATRDGSSFTSGELTYFNNSDDRTVTASFSIDCP